MTIDATAVRDNFVLRLTNFLKVPTPSIKIRSRLAQARAVALRVLPAEDYIAAMLQAHSLSPGGLPWDKV
jgi:hypothetical protein